MPVSAVSKQGKRLITTSNGLYSNARSALYAVALIERPNRAWLPSYLCSAVVDPFVKAGIEVRFYPVGGDLSIEIENVSFAQGDAVVIISYFGISQDMKIYQRLKELGLLVVEDLSQAVFAEPSPLADYSVYSPRKFFALPDGGVVIPVQQTGITWPVEGRKSTAQFFHALEAHAERTLFNAGFLDTREWHGHFQQSESLMGVELTPMSAFSKSMMLFVVDWEREKAKRRVNFDYLANHLTGIGVLERNEADVPLGFPIAVENRDRIRQRLFDQEIFPPIHWDIEGLVPKQFSASHELSKKIMTLPCDARYAQADLERVVKIIEDDDDGQC